MDEFDKNPFDSSEIDRIQAEIDKDLMRINAEAGISTTAESNIQPPLNCEGTRQTVNDSIVYPNYGNNAAAAEMDSNTQFFKETVKCEAEKKSKRRFKQVIALFCVIAILGGGSAGVAIALTNKNSAAVAAESNVTVSQSPSFTFLQDENGILNELKVEPLSDVPTFADLIDAVEPSVACITAIKTTAIDTGEFFSIPMPDASAEAPYGGSGIIFDKDDEKLYIVTNNHVVSGASAVSVSISGSEDVPAILVGREADSDLAVISVNIKDLQQKGVNDFVIAAFANSKSMRVGDFVIAVGNALGEGNTATFGFVSAVDKEINVDGQPFTVIQTDAAINPGNSGGPLINLKGEVIGINMVKFVKDSVEGTGYALTSEVAMPLIEQIRNKTARPLLGISGINMTQTVASAYSLPMMGIIVDSVVTDSGADKAGIKASDIITSFNGKAVLSMSQLTEEVQKCNIGDKVEVKLIRDGETAMTIEVTLLEDNSTNF